MKKLNLDALVVESFETVTPPAQRGTVQGAASLPFDPCTGGGIVSGCNSVCPSWCATCERTCPETCEETCGVSCVDTECVAAQGCGGAGNLCRESGSCIENTEFYTAPVL